MNTTDPIADMLTRIRNASNSKHKTVDIPASKMKRAIAEILFEEGYIASFEDIKDVCKNRRKLVNRSVFSCYSSKAWPKFMDFIAMKYDFSKILILYPS